MAGCEPLRMHHAKAVLSFRVRLERSLQTKPTLHSTSTLTCVGSPACVSMPMN